MITPSALFERISTCAEALRNQQPPVGDHVTSYEEVLKFLPTDKATGRKNKDLTKASLEFLKLGFSDRSAMKAKIALYISNLVANGNDNDGLAKEVCDRFKVINDFDRRAMDEIFNFCLCNDRARRMLDNTLVSKTRSIHPTIKHESNVEFVIIFFNVMENLVARGHALTDLGFPASVSSSDMEIARSIMEKHLDDIAAKCFPCFKKQVLKIPRKQNNLFPAGDALPIVSIGCEHVNYEEATVATLEECLMEKEEKVEFLQMMFAVVSHVSNEPSVTFGGLHVESVKTYFLENMLDEVQAKEALKTTSQSAEVFELRKELHDARKKIDALEREKASREEYWEKIGLKFDSYTKELPQLRDKVKELEEENSRLKSDLRDSEKLNQDFRDYFAENADKTKRKRGPFMGKMDKTWLMNSMEHDEGGEEENEWSGDEDE